MGVHEVALAFEITKALSHLCRAREDENLYPYIHVSYFYRKFLSKSFRCTFCEGNFTVGLLRVFIMQGRMPKFVKVWRS